MICGYESISARFIRIESVRTAADWLEVIPRKPPICYWGFGEQMLWDDVKLLQIFGEKRIRASERNPQFKFAYSVNANTLPAR